MSDQAKMFCQQQGAGLVGRPVYVREPFQPTPEEIAEWRRKEEEQRKAYEEQQRKEHRKQLRDAFAMAALTGLLAHRNNAPSFISTHQDQRARMAYEYADAMLKARGDD